MIPQLQLSVWVKTFPGLLVVAGIICIWFGMENSHAGVGFFGGFLILVAILIHIYVYEEELRLRDRLIDHLP